MAFNRHGAPEQLEVLKDRTVDTIVCKKCSGVLIRPGSGAKINIGAGVVTVTCKCGEISHV